MTFELNSSVDLLRRTPHVLYALLYDAGELWLYNNEGEATWSPFDVIGHLIHCDKHNWMPRIGVCLSESPVKLFEPLDRFAQFEASKGKTANQLLEEFLGIRDASIDKLIKMELNIQQLSGTAIHPDFGEVTLSQLLSAWVAHDLDHISQICRLMAKQYKEAVGPWVKYMRILNQ